MGWLDRGVLSNDEWEAFSEGYDSFGEKAEEERLEAFREAGRTAAEEGLDEYEAFEEALDALDDD